MASFFSPDAQLSNLSTPPPPTSSSTPSLTSESTTVVAGLPEAFEPRSMSSPAPSHVDFSAASILSTEREVYRAAAGGPLSAATLPLGGLVDDSGATGFKATSAFDVPTLQLAHPQQQYRVI
eukprot:GABV01001800.1.p1 GENE.GABV01001800.1~~GABV01001800.1.p1  ORF type:complete len:122 (-),score=38.16 GABV01001800.1:351-716(-)